MSLPPGPRGPSPWTTARFAHRPLDALLRWHARYGDVFTVRFTGFGTGVYVADPDAIRELMTGDQSDLLAGEANAFLAPVLGERSVLVLDGPEHLRQRRLLLPPFQGSRVRGFREVIRDVAEREVSTWRAGDEIVVRERMRSLTFGVIARLVFGVTDPERVARLRSALGAVLDASSLLLVPGWMRRDLGPRSPWGRMVRRLRVADALLHEEIRRRRDEDLEGREDVLSLLLRARDEDGRALTDAELRDELMTMLAAGHETTATGLAFAVDLLLRHPTELARLRTALGGPAADAHLDAVARETLRLRPVIDAAERTLTRPRTVAGHRLGSGVKVYPAIALVHRRADLYPEPSAFRPDRFLEGEAESYAWLPFGGGIRRCIGASLAQAEMAEVLRIVVERIELEPVSPAPDPVVLRGVTLAPRDGVRVRVADVRPAIPTRARSGAAASAG